MQDFFEDKFKYSAPIGFLKEIADFISWNLWQMDGLNYSVPLLKQAAVQGNLFAEEKTADIFCKVMDWEKNKSEYFVDWIKEGEANGKV